MTSVSSNAVQFAFCRQRGAELARQHTMVAIQNQASEGGLLGMLDNAGGDGSVSSFLGSSVKTANAFALISQNNLTKYVQPGRPNSRPEPA